jgi:hypothetical protein
MVSNDASGLAANVNGHARRRGVMQVEWSKALLTYITTDLSEQELDHFCRF